MRVRINHNPEMLELINRETCPVWLNYTYRGFPRELPAFDGHFLDLVPWFRLNASHFVLMDNDGSRIFGGGWEIIPLRTLERPEHEFGPMFDDEPYPRSKLQDGIDRFHEYHRLAREVEADPGRKPQLDDFFTRLGAWRDKADLPTREPRAWTAMIILDFMPPNPWAVFSERFRHPGPDVPEPLAPGVRNSALHAFAKVAAGTTPLIPVAKQMVDIFFETWRKLNQEDPSLVASAKFAAAHDDGSHFPYAIRYRAAKGAELTAGINLFQGGQDEDVVAVFKKWYAVAKDDPQYEVVWPENSAAPYAFASAPYADACGGTSCSAPAAPC